MIVRLAARRRNRHGRQRERADERPDGDDRPDGADRDDHLQAGSDTGTSSSDNITNATTLVFDVNFSESVAGWRGPTSRTQERRRAASSGRQSAAPTNYTVTLTGCSAGTVIVRLAAAGVTDTAGNANAQTNGSTRARSTGRRRP